jgi:Winged helix-turn-helix domain (DUF2582)
MIELLLPIFVFYLFYLNYAMNPPKAPLKNSVPKSEPKQLPASVAADVKPKKATAKPKTIKPKSAPVSIAEQTVAVLTSETKAKKSNRDLKRPKKAHAETFPEAAGVPGLAFHERVGLTAGAIWHYLSENGATSVATLVRELTEEEKIIQRSIGWLAQEGKITLNITDKVETISLKD